MKIPHGNYKEKSMAEMGLRKTTKVIVNETDSLTSLYKIGDIKISDPILNGDSLVFSLAGNYWTNSKYLTASSIQFTQLGPMDSYAIASLQWNSEYATLMLGMNGVAAPLGQAMYKRIRNNTGNTLNKGEVVYVTGAHGAANITVDLANANNEATAATTIGVVAEEILNNKEGFIITQGYLKGINTNSIPGSEGDALWLDTVDGGFTTTRPTQPNHGVAVGWIVKKAGGGAGSIYVRITNGQELYEIHDVLITSPADGEVLTWESATSLWKNKPSTGGSGGGDPMPYIWMFGG